MEVEFSNASLVDLGLPGKMPVARTAAAAVVRPSAG